MFEKRKIKFVKYLIFGSTNIYTYIFLYFTIYCWKFSNVTILHFYDTVGNFLMSTLTITIITVRKHKCDRFLTVNIYRKNKIACQLYRENQNTI